MSARRHIDLVAREHQHGRISSAAFDVARQHQAALEGPSRTGGSAWAERVDGTRSGDAAGVGMIDAAQRAETAMRRVRDVVGRFDARILRALLIDGLTFDEVAESEGKSGDRGANYIAHRFRDALEELAQPRKAVGARVPNIVDKYSSMCGAVKATGT